MSLIDQIGIGGVGLCSVNKSWLWPMRQHTHTHTHTQTHTHTHMR